MKQELKTMSKKDYIQISISVDPVLLEKVKAIAVKEQRTMTGQIRYMLKKSVAAHEKS